jgi:alanine-synthesizing transaminase
LDTYLSVNTPSQNALARWLSFKAVIQGEISRRLKQNRQQLIEQLHHWQQCEVLNAEGGWYGIVRLPAEKTEEEWVLTFLEKESVFVHPGYFFDFHDEPYMVISLLMDPTVLSDALDRLKRVIQQ